MFFLSFIFFFQVTKEKNKKSLHFFVYFSARIFLCFFLGHHSQQFRIEVNGAFRKTMTSYVTLSFHWHLLSLSSTLENINPFLSPSTSISFCLLYYNSSPRIYYRYTFFSPFPPLVCPTTSRYFIPSTKIPSFFSLRISSIFSPLYFFSFPSCLLSPFP